MKISLITTIYNEEPTIAGFLKSIEAQTAHDFEFVVVDGGSQDATTKIVKEWVLKAGKRFKSRLYVKRGNRSVGRNEAIKYARGDIIVVTDAGCILDSEWLKNITSPFEDKNIDVVSGFYKPKASTIFQKCLSCYTSTMADKVDPQNFLPSSRSVAFRRKAWEKAGGYPEKLDTCEDLVFDQKLKRVGCLFKFEKKAFVWWPQRKNIIESTMQFFSYAKGDGQALYFRKTTPFLFLRYIVGFSLILYIFSINDMGLLLLVCLGLIGYVSWAIYKNYKYVKNSKALLYLPVLQFTSDFAVMSGMIVGLLKHLVDN